MLEAFGKNIIVKPIYPEKKQVAVLLTKEESPLYWEVISIGKKVEGVNIGDKLILLSYGMTHVEYKGEKHYVINCENIYARDVS
jgi:co-chaperonin GroES (HSP10)